MKCYAVADLHGKPGRLETVRRMVSELAPDMVAVAGDITNYRGAGDTVDFLSDLGIPVLGVRGNTDLWSVDRRLRTCPRTASLHLAPRKINGIRFVGIGGTIPLPFRSRVCWREQSALATLETMIDEKTLVVAHPPPWGVLDQVMGKYSAGSHGLRSLIERRPPAALICGHIHERPGVENFGATVVVNCAVSRRSMGAIIEYDGLAPPRATILK